MDAEEECGSAHYWWLLGVTVCKSSVDSLVTCRCDSFGLNDTFIGGCGSSRGRLRGVVVSGRRATSTTWTMSARRPSSPACAFSPTLGPNRFMSASVACWRAPRHDVPLFFRNKLIFVGTGIVALEGALRKLKFDANGGTLRQPPVPPCT